jgi:hypothetical protein
MTAMIRSTADWEALVATGFDTFQRRSTSVRDSHYDVDFAFFWPGTGKTGSLAILLEAKSSLRAELAFVEAEQAEAYRALTALDITVADAFADAPLVRHRAEFDNVEAEQAQSFRALDALEITAADDFTDAIVGHLDLWNRAETRLPGLFTAEHPMLAAQRRARRVLLRRLRCAAFVAHAVRNRLRNVCRLLFLALCQRILGDVCGRIFIREISWYLVHGTHPPANDFLRNARRFSFRDRAVLSF